MSPPPSMRETINTMVWVLVLFSFFLEGGRRAGGRDNKLKVRNSIMEKNETSLQI